MKWGKVMPDTDIGDLTDDEVSEYLANGDKHRFVFKPLKINNAQHADIGELVVDPTTGDIYVKNADGQLRSKSAEVYNKLQELEAAGIIQAALAFENNAKIYTVYVRGNKCRIDIMTRLNKSVRYYAIRGVSETGEHEYITGNLVNGFVENALVDVIHDTSNPEAVFTGEAMIGTLHTPSSIYDGHPYLIDLFDSSRHVIATTPCQVKKTEKLDYSLSPEKNIVALEISTNQDMIERETSNNIAFLYRGQSFNTLNIYVAAVYANGDKRYINHDLATSRLIISYPPDISTEDVGSNFNIQAKYYTEELNTGEGEEYNDLNFSSIDATHKVTIIEDVYVGVKYLFPIPFVKANNDGGKSIQLHTFARYENDTFVDVTNNARLASTNFAEEQFGISQIFGLSLGVGHGGTTYTEYDIRLNMNAEIYGRWSTLIIPNAPKADYPCYIARFDPISNPGQIRMRLLRNTSELFASTSEFASLGSIIQNSTTVYPTHFRVRSIIDSSFMHTIEPVPITQYNEFNTIDTDVVVNKLAGYAGNNGSIPYPVLVEFYVYVAQTNKYRFISGVPFISQMVVFSSIQE
jgi:hypothetical protein